MKSDSADHVKILIVEDDQITAAHLERILYHLGYEISACVASGAEAIASVEENRPHVVLMDINLDGDMTGIDAAHVMRRRHRLPVIYLTAFSDSDIIRQAGMSEPYGYLVKPIQRETLQSTIQMALYKSRIDEELHESEARHRIITEVITDLAYQFAFTEVGIITTRWFNEAFARIINFRSEGLDALEHWQSLILPEDIPVYKDHIQTLRKGEKSSCEYRIQLRSGEVRWMRDYATPEWTGSTMQTLVVYGAAQDITLNRMAEQAIISSEYLFNTTINSMRNWIHVVDRDLRLILVNKAFRRICAELNLPGTLLGQRIDEAFPFLNDKVIEEYRQVFREGISITSRESMLFGFRTIETETVKSPVYEGGSVVRVITTITDITGIMASEDALRTSEARLRGVIDSARDCIFIKDTQKRYVVANPALASLYGQPQEKIVGHSDADFLAPGIAADIDEIDNAVLAGAPNDQEVSFEIQGTLRHFHTIKAPLHGPSGIIGICGITRDITDRITTEEALKSSEEKLRELNASKDKLFSIVAHDMRGPFTTMLGFMEIIQSEYDNLSDDELKEYIDYVMSSFMSVYRLIENLLQWSRIQTGRIRVSPMHLILLHEVQDSVNFHHSMAMKKRVGVSIDVPASLTVYADKELLQAVIRNLLSNAIKFTPEGGSITLAGRASAKEVSITVADTGIGMNPEALARLFSPTDTFTTLGTDQEKGTGLGLMLSKELTELQHGSISVQSEEGRGTTFTIILPTDSAVRE